MTFAIKSQLLQQQIQKQTVSIKVTPHFTKLDFKGLYFLLYAEYDIILQTFQMKHAAYLQKKLIAKSKFQQTQQIRRKYQVISQKNHDKIIKFNSSVDKLLNKLQFLWNQKSIPFFHRYYFQKNIDNDMRIYVQSLQKLILNEQKLIKNDVHIIYSLQKSIRARQSCLFQVKRFLSSLKQSDIEDHLYCCTQRLYYIRSKKQKLQYQIQGYKINKVMDRKVSKNIFQPTKFQLFGQCYHHLIKLTLHAIQLISKWKDYLYSLTPDLLKKKQQIDYYFEEENYLLRIINDMNFMQTSFLTKYLKFAPKNDPFLLLPLLQLQKEEQSIQENILLNKSDDVHIQESNQIKCLKRIFAPQTEGQMIQILQKMRILVQQFQINIKNRKIYDLKIIHKINDLDYTKKSSIRLTKSQIKPINMIQSVKTELFSSQGMSPKFMRSSSLQKNQKLKLSKIIPSNSVKILPSLKQVKQSRQITSPSINSKNINLLRNSSVALFPTRLKKNLSINSQKNDFQEKLNGVNQTIGLQLMNHKQLQIIKQQLKQKLKKQFALNSNKTSNRIFQKPELAEYIQSQVKKVFLQTKFQSQWIDNNQNGRQLQLKDLNLRNKTSSQLFVETYSIQESQLISHINFLFQKQSLLKYQNLQVSKEQLLQGYQNYNQNLKGLQQLQNAYFLKVKQRIKTSITKRKGKQKIRQNQQIYQNEQQLKRSGYQKVQNPQKYDSNNYQHIQQYQQKLLSHIIFTTRYIPSQSSLLYSSSLNKNQIKLQKCIQILYMTIKQQQIFKLQKIILKIVEFLFKYQTSQSIILKFFYDSNKQQQKQKINELKSILQINNCMIAQKAIINKNNKNNNKNKKVLLSPIKNTSNKIKQVQGSNNSIIQVKFHFTRKDQQKICLRNLSCNIFDYKKTISLDPFTISLNLSGLFSSQKLYYNQQCSKLLNYLNQLNYDYLLTQIIKNHLNSDHFSTIKNKSLWQHRLRVIIENILSLQKNQSQKQKHLPFLQIIQAQNLTQLNKILQSKNKPIWTGITDLLKSNVIKMYLLDLKITLPYHRKAFIHSRTGIPYFKFQIYQQIQVLNLKINLKSHAINSNYKQNQHSSLKNRYEQQLLKKAFIKIYMIPCKERKNIMIGFFDATGITQYMEQQNNRIRKQQKFNKKAVQITISDLLNIFFSIKTQNPTQSLQIYNKQTQYIRNLYIPMIKQNSQSRHEIDQSKNRMNNNSKSQQMKQNILDQLKYSQKQLIYPIKCNDFGCLSTKKSDPNFQFYIGTNIQWFYDVNLQNGIRYTQQQNKNDIWFRKQTELKSSSKQQQIRYNNNQKSVNNEILQQNQQDYDEVHKKNDIQRNDKNNRNKKIFDKKQCKMGIVVFLIPQYVVLYTKIL